MRRPRRKRRHLTLEGVVARALRDYLLGVHRGDASRTPRARARTLERRGPRYGYRRRVNNPLSWF